LLCLSTLEHELLIAGFSRSDCGRGREHSHCESLSTRLPRVRQEPLQLDLKAGWVAAREVGAIKVDDSRGWANASAAAGAYVTPPSACDATGTEA
jgi:hypothetical protein